MQSALPAGFGGVGYGESGFCFAESAISAVVKRGTRRLDLALRTPEAVVAGGAASSDESDGRNAEGRDASPAYTPAA